MRALFTQLSLMVGLLTTLNLQAELPLTDSILLGSGAAFVVYLVLLLGDHVVNRLLEDRTDRLSSVVFLETPPELEQNPVSAADDRNDDTGARAA